MSKLSKFPLRVARRALAAGQMALPLYAHRGSPKTFTQPQPFACLVLQTFLNVDCRGLAAHLADHSDLRAALGLARAPVPGSGVGGLLPRRAGRGLREHPADPQGPVPLAVHLVRRPVLHRDRPAAHEERRPDR